MASRLKDISEQEVFNAFRIRPELFKDGSTNKEWAEIQLNKFLELNEALID